jgi:hypothetical protein
MLGLVAGLSRKPPELYQSPDRLARGSAFFFARSLEQFVKSFSTTLANLFRKFHVVLRFLLVDTALTQRFFVDPEVALTVHAQRADGW